MVCSVPLDNLFNSKNNFNKVHLLPKNISCWFVQCHWTTYSTLKIILLMYTHISIRFVNSLSSATGQT